MSRLMLYPAEVLEVPGEVVCVVTYALTLTQGHWGLVDGAWQCRLISPYQAFPDINALQTGCCIGQSPPYGCDRAARCHP